MVFLAVLAGLPKKQLPVIGVLCLWILFFHPVSSILFAVAAGLCVLKWLWAREERRAMLYGFGIFTVLSLASVMKLELFLTTYDSGQLSLEVLKVQYDNAVSGAPLVFTALAWALGLTILLTGLAARRGQTRQVSGLRIAGFGLLAVAGIILVVWASDTHSWRMAFDFRTWAIFLSLPYVGLAALDYRLNFSKLAEDRQALWKQRLPAVRLIGGIFFVVLAVQGISWLNLTGDFKTAIQQSRESCIPLESLAMIKNTPLDNWSVTPYSLLASGEPPSRVVLANNGCRRSDLTGGLPVADFDWRPWGSGHLNLEPLRRQIVTRPAKLHDLQE